MTDLRRYNQLERRFNGPIPKHLLETDADRERRERGANDLVSSMLRDYRKEEERLVSMIDAIQLKICDGTNTPFDDKEFDRLHIRLDTARRNIRSMERGVSKAGE